MKLKKAAICLHGAIAKIGDRFSTQGSLYNNNPYINYKACYNSILKHIVEPNYNYTIDFYIHGWNIDLQDDLVKIYKPIKYLFEDNSLYSNEINKKISNPEDFGGVSRALSIKKSIELLEYSGNINYDVIVIYRPDVFLLKDLNLDYYDMNKISCNDNEWADFHFIMNYDNLLKFKYLYNSLDTGNRHKYHSWIKNYINNYLHLQIATDNIIPGIHQEVCRKIYTTMIKTNNININRLLELGLIEEEIKEYK